MRRYFKMALAKLIPDKERREMQERSRYVCIDPDDKEAHSFTFNKTMRFNKRADSSMTPIKDTHSIE